ncbi:MAG: 16S rRNA (cytosine(967)-C(5))-methyltransferase RsmB [Bacillota bacterium]
MAVQILLRVLYENAYANLALEQALKHCPLSDRDRGLVTELVNGTIRMKKHLDWVLDLFLVRNQRKLKSKVYVILILSLYQMLFLERVPAYAIINEAVEMARSEGQGVSGLVNGLLRNVERNKDHITYPDPNRDMVSYLAVFYSHPEWMVARWLERYGLEETRKLLAFNNQGPPLTVRANRMKNDARELRAVLEEEGVMAREGMISQTSLVLESIPVPLFRLGSYREGLFYVQGESTMLIPLCLSPRPGTLVYDFCCGVGGKTTHLAEIMGNQGTIIAFDMYRHKLELLGINCRRLGIGIVEGREGNLFASIRGLDQADSVLLDVPCSGLGVLRSRADLRWRRKEADIELMSNLQSQMLEQVARTVRSGGKLLYSTCSLEPEENQKVVERFIQGHRDFEFLDFDEILESNPWLDSGAMSMDKGRLTIFPPRHQIDGMFISLMRRN